MPSVWVLAILIDKTDQDVANFAVSTFSNSKWDVCDNILKIFVVQLLLQGLPMGDPHSFQESDKRRTNFGILQHRIARTAPKRPEYLRRGIAEIQPFHSCNFGCGWWIRPELPNLCPQLHADTATHPSSFQGKFISTALVSCFCWQVLRGVAVTTPRNLHPISQIVAKPLRNASSKSSCLFFRALQSAETSASMQMVTRKKQLVSNIYYICVFF